MSRVSASVRYSRPRVRVFSVAIIIIIVIMLLLSDWKLHELYGYIRDNSRTKWQCFPTSATLSNLPVTKSRVDVACSGIDAQRIREVLHCVSPSAGSFTTFDRSLSPRFSLDLSSSLSHSLTSNVTLQSVNIDISSTVHIHTSTLLHIRQITNKTLCFAYSSFSSSSSLTVILIVNVIMFGVIFSYFCVFYDCRMWLAIFVLACFSCLGASRFRFSGCLLAELVIRRNCCLPFDPAKGWVWIGWTYI